MPALHRRPSDRAYATLHWTCMALIALGLLHGLVLARFIATPRFVGFRLVILMILAFNVLWWSVADRRLARHVASKPFSAAWRIAVAAITLGLASPILWMLFTGRMASVLNTAPVWYSTAVTIWNVAIGAILPIVALVRLGLLGLAACLRRWQRPIGLARPATVDESRRAFLRTSLASVPILVLGGATAEGCSQEGRFEIHRHDLPAPWLPDRLRGLKITHISDLHVGRLYRPSMLPKVVEAANRLDGDIVLVTGDLVDTSNDFLPPVMEALSGLTHRHGLFVCIGNHDEIDDRAEFIATLRRSHDLLIDERRPLVIGGERLCIAGLDYTRRDAPSPGRASHAQAAARTLANYDAAGEGPIITMAHHPHAWDALAAAGVPLTLSGHTHGGQIMLSSPSERPDRGLGPLLFRYVRGFYGRGGATLFVNSGVGNWFPLRFRAPAEIVQIRMI